VFRGNSGSECVSESASNDGVTAADEPTGTLVDKRQHTPSSDAGHLVRHEIAPALSSSAASSTGRRHDYHQLQIAGYDTHCYAANDAACAAAAAGYLPGAPLSCIPPYFTSNTRANVFHSNHSLDTTGAMYSMQRA